MIFSPSLSVLAYPQRRLYKEQLNECKNGQCRHYTHYCHDLQPSISLEVLFYPMQEREQKALSSSLRALELQQLAAGSNSPLDANQLSAAAQRCTSEAEQAAQMASLARAEAARLLGHGPALGVSAERPAPALMDTAAFLACDDTPAVGAAMQLRPNAQTDAPSPEQAQLSTSSVDVVRGLSADMQAAMQRLVASTRSSSSAAVPGPESEIATPSGAGVHAGGTGTATEYGQGQGVPDLSIPNLAASSAYQMPHLPNQESWQIPALDSASPVRSAEDAQIPPLSDQGTVEVAEDRGLSGMQIHLMQQLEGLERSMRRVEQQVSSTKQTRRRLKTPSSPAQVTLPPFLWCSENICRGQWAKLVTCCLTHFVVPSLE